VRAAMAEQALGDRPMYFVSSNPHSIVNLVSGTARRREARSRAGSSARARGPARRARRVPRRAARRARGRTSSTSPRATSSRRSPPRCRSALARRSARSAHAHLLADRAARVRAGDRARPARPAWLDPRLGDVDADKLAAARR
jgi:hypothetical protein